MKRLFLVSCVKTKQQHPSRAAELYISYWFVKARQLVEATGCPWFILSAKHGLLAPDEIIAPYEQTLNTMPSKECKAWAEKVRQQMESELPDADEVVILAGQNYREHLLHYLENRFPSVKIPMEGLRMAEQRKWLGNADVSDL